MSKLETQALQKIRPFERRMTIVGNAITSKIANIATYLKNIFKPHEKTFNLEDRKFEIPEKYKIKEKRFKEELKVKEGALSDTEVTTNSKEKQQKENTKDTPEK